MTSSTIEDIQSRIAAIQLRMGISPQTTDVSDSSLASSASFQDTLSSLLSSSGSSSSADPTSSSLSSLSSQLSSYLNGAGGSGSGAPSGDSVVADATQYLGVPYVWGGTNPATGLDCSGLVQRVFGDMGVSMPRTAAAQAQQGTSVPSLAQAQPGDLVAFGSPVDHIGIYAGNNKMIVAPHKGDVVKLEDVYTKPTAIRRIVGTSATSNTSALSTLSSLLGSNGGSSSALTKLLGGNSTTALSAAYGSNSSSSTNFGGLSSSYNSMFVAAGAKYGISPTLLAAVAKQESGFNPNAASGAGAQGLMQLMPATAKSLGVNAMDPAQAIDGAAKMLSGLATKFGSTPLALAAYNAGPGAVQKYNGIPPYAETQNYVKNILAMQQTGTTI